MTQVAAKQHELSSVKSKAEAGLKQGCRGVRREDLIGAEVASIVVAPRQLCLATHR